MIISLLNLELYFDTISSKKKMKEITKVEEDGKIFIHDFIINKS